MSHSANFIAADLGASGGRVMVGRWDGRKFSLKLLHRFPNAGVRAAGTLYWDALGLWARLQEGIAKYQTQFSDAPRGIGIDAWGVDFALIDRDGQLLGNPLHYRDSRTENMVARAMRKLDEEQLFCETGVQTSRINTLFQLYSMTAADDSSLDRAAALLMIPDLFLYFLCGEARTEFSEATTTQMFSLRRNDWAWSLLKNLDIPLHILPAVDRPGTIRGTARQEVLRDCGLGVTFPVIAVASHDTASAVAAIPGMDLDSVFISSGTWSLMGVQVDRPNTSPEAMRLRFTNEGGASGLLLLRNLTGFWIIQECMKKWELSGSFYTWDEIVSASMEAPSMATFIDPDTARFQAPGDMPETIHQYCVATSQQPPETVGAIARCAFESLCLKYRSVLQSLEHLTGRHLTTLRVVGGGSRNAVLCQMMADCCNRRVASGPAEASALGNVLLQAVAIGHLNSLAEGQAALKRSVRCKEFLPHRSDAWDHAFARFQSLAKA